MVCNGHVCTDCIALQLYPFGWILESDRVIISSQFCFPPFISYFWIWQTSRAGRVHQIASWQKPIGLTWSLATTQVTLSWKCAICLVYCGRRCACLSHSASYHRLRTEAAEQLLLILVSSQLSHLLVKRKQYGFSSHIIIFQGQTGRPSISTE